MKQFCESLREHAKNIISFEKKNVSINKRRAKSHQDANVCYVCGKKILQKLVKNKIIEKLETIAMLQVNTEVQHIVYEIYDLMCPIKSL